MWRGPNDDALAFPVDARDVGLLGEVGGAQMSVVETSIGRVRNGAILGGYRAASLVARGVPMFAAGAVTAPIALGASAASAPRRALVARHLQRVDPALSGTALRRSVQAAFESYARYYLESFRLPHLSAVAVDAGLRTTGFVEHVLPALERGHGAILALPHLGGWEWAGRWLADRGHRVTAVVERIEPPELFEWFVRLRADLGMNVVPLGPDVGSILLGALQRNEIVCLLCDRDLTRSGIEVDFFGERTTLPAGPALLGLRTGAPVLPAAVYFGGRSGDEHLGVVLDPLDTARRPGSLRADVARVTQDLAGALEDLIRRAPTQWHLQQPNWPSDPGYADR